MERLGIHGVITRTGDVGSTVVVCRDRKGNYLGSSVVTFQSIVDPATTRVASVL